MDTFGRQQDVTTDEPTDLDGLVTCHTTRPGKAVFTERDNCDGWIATDLTVELEP
ncbi:hypothetical protein OB955_00550 [Halobacteria archaeon AArc-m2/3/4]|uniref:Uncharacterized protein n=1 Tax=Natronoglomus mannanivorans TaxID=2979990 RepID=A0AAP2Z081_9EURY|nr:hypothetical protein [Halobacteria archaeon AArc-xg1-1]MCU4971227.1 hypothetical protein [Halobacteria archaeon AArc-m2/3/4]